MEFVITEEIVEKYINVYFKKRYPIHPDFKEFWKLVTQVVIDENSKLKIENDRRGYFIRYKVGSIDHFTIESKESKTTEDFIKFVAKQIKDVIYKYEKEVVTLTGVDYFMYDMFLNSKDK